MRRRALALAAIALLGLVLLALGVRATRSGEVLPGVRVEGIDLAGASPGEVRRLLSPIADAAAHKPVTLVAEDRRVKLAPVRAGYVVDLPETVSDALGSGRGGPLGGLWTTVAGLFSERDVALVQRVDRRRLERAVDSLADRLGRRAVAATLVIDPGTLAVQTTAPRAGREVDRGAFADRLERVLARRPRGAVEVPLRTTRVAGDDDVDAVANAARAFLGAPLTLTGPGAPVEVSPAELAGVLALVSSDGGRRVRLGAGDAALAKLVDAIAAKRDRPARDARVDAPPRAVTFAAKGEAAWRPRAADVTILRDARAGRIVRRDRLTSAIETAIRSGRHTLELPTVRVEPKVDAAAARKLNSLIGTFTTYYVPGQPRVTNIKRIAADVDATIVAPGARFSLNETAGERTRAGGYVEAPFIADGKIKPSIGGGVSQFSTTLYNAAYFAGLRIDGHRPHSFFIDRYPAGREATVNFPDIDMTWTNDTEAPVLIRASTDANSVAVSLYGDNGGRRVEAKAGDREPLPDGDFQVVVTREIRYPDGRVVQQPFTTRYDKPPEDE